MRRLAGRPRTPAPTQPVAWVDVAAEELLEQSTVDQIASWTAAVVLVGVSLASGSGWGIVLGGLVGLLALVRLRSREAFRQRDLTRGLVWHAIGSWGIAVAVVAIAPFALPIMVLTMIGVLLTSAIYLDASATRRMTVAGVAIAIVLGIIGVRTGGVGIEDTAPRWVVDLVVVTYLALHVVMLGDVVATSNRVRLETLAGALDANTELERTSQQLRDSRNRVVAAGDAERVRIERDIHDGAQQRLVALAVQLKLASQLTRSGSPPDAELLDDLHAQAREAVDGLRDLARGIYPALLAERGLREALQSGVERTGQQTTIECGPFELRPDAEAAVYFFCTEALQNVAKHAGDDVTSSVEIRRDGDLLRVTIADDGVGFDPASVGGSRGLLNMHDRVGALGGELIVDSRPGGGTTVAATMLMADVTRPDDPDPGEAGTA